MGDGAWAWARVPTNIPGMYIRMYEYRHTSTYIRKIRSRRPIGCLVVVHIVLLVVCRSHCYDTIRLLPAVDQYVPMISYDAWHLVYGMISYIIFSIYPSYDICQALVCIICISGIITYQVRTYVCMIWYSHGVFLRKSNDFYRSLKRCSNSSKLLLFLGAHT